MCTLVLKDFFFFSPVMCECACASVCKRGSASTYVSTCDFDQDTLLESYCMHFAALTFYI